MTYRVLKFGGTSVATLAKLRRIARWVAQVKEQCDGVVVVVSAMGDTTDRLVTLATRITAIPPAREMDMLLSTGENITAPLLTMTLINEGIQAISLTGLQAGIRTSTTHRSARITDVVPQRILGALEQGNVVVVAGFQGVTEEFDITTLGRGGSDTSAVALAVAIGAPSCEIYTDVSGIYTADPRVVKDARAIGQISYEEMLEFTAVGAKVMHPRAVEIGEAYNVPIWVRSAFGNDQGTLICNKEHMEERQKVSGIAHETDVAKVTLLAVPDRPGIAATVFGNLAEHNINVDIVVQNFGHQGATDVSFIIDSSNFPQADTILADIADSVNAQGYDTNSQIAKVSIVGTGMLNTPGMVATMFHALADANINIQMISTSQIRATCIIDQAHVEDAVRVLHKAYALEKF